MRPYRTEYRLWGVLTEAFMVGFCLAEYEYDHRGMVAGDLIWARRGFEYFNNTAPDVAIHLSVMLAMATAAAWSAHAVLVLCGVRIPAFRLTRLPVEAADYDDAMPPVEPTA